MSFNVKYISIVFIIFMANSLLAQNDSIIELDEIVLPIFKLKNFSKGYSMRILKKSSIAKNKTSLTDVLRYNSFLYFKENGHGMVSSPSFRGTSASQTAVVWNGININSQLTGQTDFNTIPINSLNSISIRNGGGSVLYGSGAIGGTIHLNNNILFKKKQESNLSVSYGSFNTINTFFNGTFSSKKSHINTTIEYNTSDNDYRFLGTSLFNENGSYTNVSFSGNFGYKFDKKNQLKYYTTTFFGDRNLSRTLTAPSKQKYKNVTTKNLVAWNHFINSKEIITTKLAFLGEKYTFFEDNTKPEFFSGGTSTQMIGVLDYKNKLSSKINLEGIISFESAVGRGDNIEKKIKKVFTSVVLINHKLTQKLSYGIQLRKEYIKTYNSPLVYSLGIDYKVNKNYTLSFNTSKNFRTPTFNDLYWKFGGNPNLKPETSQQIELGSTLKVKKFKIQFNIFYIKSIDLIQWKPDSSGSWTPTNIAQAKNYGSETSLYYIKKVGNHIFKTSANYSLTIAKNVETDKDLNYVPLHRTNFSLDYNYKNISAFYQQLINGEVLVIGDVLPTYTVSNFGVEYQFTNQKVHPKLGLKINNIFNTNYQNILNRPMPTRNIQITINYKF